MKKFKILFLLLISIGFTSSLLAQVNESYYKRYKKEYADSLKKIYAAKRDSIINNAEFIFEGKVIQSCLNFTDSGFVGYDIIQIEKIYRGYEKLKFGLIEVLVISKNGIPTSQEKNIIFCKRIQSTNTCFPKQMFDNHFKVVLVDNLFSVSPDKEELTGLYNLTFSSYDKARSYLSKYPNIDIKDENSDPTLKKSQFNEGVNAKQNEINKKRYFQFQDSLMKLKKN
jgi:hypothetical protein